MASMVYLCVCVCVCVCVSKLSGTAKEKMLKDTGKHKFSCIVLLSLYNVAKLFTVAKVQRKIKKTKD